MKIKLVVDSSCDLDEALRARTGAVSVPFVLSVDDREFVDTPDMDVLAFLDAMEKSAHVPKSSCPSPGDFAEQYSGADAIFVSTITSKLSGSYASAVAARSLAEHPERVYVLDSLSAVSGQTCQLLEMVRCIDLGMSPDELFAHMQEFVSKMNTVFVLGSVNSLVKNGRMGKIAGTLVEALNIKPVLEAVEGEVGMVDKARGVKRGMERLAKLTEERFPGAGGHFAVISHVQNPEMAEYLKQMLEEKCNFGEIVVVESRGLGSLYAVRGGIILSF